MWLEFFSSQSLILILLINNEDLTSISFSIGVIAATAFRILPSVNRIINSLQSLKNDFSAIENINKELELPIKENQNSSNKFNYIDNKIVLKNVITIPTRQKPR